MCEILGRGLLMSVIKAIILGIVQGLTEFLPVSSSGHLVLLQKIFNIEECALTFDIAFAFRNTNCCTGNL